MNIISRLVVGGICVIGATVVGAKAKSEVKADYNITASEEAFFSACTLAMSTNDVKFNKGASKNKGCACITKKTLSEHENEAALVLKNYVTALIAQGGEDPDDVKVQMEIIGKIGNINRQYNVSMADSMTYISSVTEAVGTCGDRKFHTPANVVQIAALTPKSPGVTKVADNRATQQSKKAVKAPSKPKEPAPALRGPSKLR